MYKVLIVDDEELEREGLKYILKDNCNFEVVGTAENGNEAVTKANKLEPDIILMDIKIPGIDGLEASRIIKENNPEIEIVLLTAYSQFSYSHKAIKIKVADYLLKPIKPKQLIEALTNLGEIINKKNTAMAEIPILPVQINDLHKMLVEEIKMLNRNNIYDILIKINETANSVLDTTTEKHFKFIAYELVFLASRVIIESGVDINKASNLKNAYIKELKEIRISYVFVNWSNNMIHSFISLMYSNDNINSKCPIESAKKYISDNYYEDLTLTSIAKYIHLNPSYLSRCFKEKTGMNLIEYLTNYRIFKAKELLKTKQFTIDQISKKVGFKSNSYFTSVFKKNEKISPNDYRKKAFIENL